MAAYSPSSSHAASAQHIPVLLNEVLEALSPKDGETYVDGTFGAGGYSRAILNHADCRVVAIDRDPDAIERAKLFAEEFPDRFKILEGCFGDMAALLRDAGEEKIDGVVLDIGVSSFQLDEAERGFSFRADGPLDMRMSASGESAADVVNEYGEEDLANIIYEYGEERKSRRVASAIVRRRQEEQFERTKDLANVVERAVGHNAKKRGGKQVHPATRTFQALRIHVNDELGELRRGLASAEAALDNDGRLVVVSFHSLEDRIVKNFLADKSGKTQGQSRHMPMSVNTDKSTFSLGRRSVVKPSDEECERNPRARSSKLRAAVRINAVMGEG